MKKKRRRRVGCTALMAGVTQLQGDKQNKN